MNNKHIGKQHVQTYQEIVQDDVVSVVWVGQGESHTVIQS